MQRNRLELQQSLSGEIISTAGRREPIRELNKPSIPKPWEYLRCRCHNGRLRVSDILIYTGHANRGGRLMLGRYIIGGQGEVFADRVDRSFGGFRKFSGHLRQIPSLLGGCNFKVKCD
ncbi:hypothetical protein AVEN_59417-1 [Araneus ventricosus]|uniref:Uncharacterized protein n=1 Tax=Araneus ventricosus TaxID=182803 RepID=A0A4Y2KJG0_ARAVE|nr:hypothetical protein AVEN_59417-1 [Araneus ventricosus]